MTTGTLEETRVSILKEQIDSIHLANYFFWKLAPYEQTRQARMDYQRRRARLEAIRRELLQIQITGRSAISQARSAAAHRPPPSGSDCGDGGATA